MLQLSEEDHQTIRSLRAFGVLEAIEGHHIDRSRGAVLVCCADGDQFYDDYTHHCKIQLEQRKDHPRIHTLSWNGGAMCCAEQSPVNRLPDSHIEFLGQICDARGLKTIDPIILETHAPCGAANLHHISLLQQITIHMEVKRRVKEMNPGAAVACNFHVDYGEGHKRSYFLNRPRWEAWLTENNIGVETAI